ncbi:MAG: GIY-YIG nuclease family protein, partial [Bacteroidota bacterium]
MAAFCYILHSESLGKFYIGVTSLKPEERLEFHLDGRYGKKSFSAAANDWKIFYTIECESSRQA